MLKYFFFFSLFFFENSVYSHHKVYGAKVDEGRQSLEWRGHFNLDQDNVKNKEHHHVLETEYSWTSFWQSEVEFHISDKEDTPLDWEKLELQNQVQFFESKFYSAAIYFSYNFVSEGTKADEIEYKFLSEFENNYFNLISNFIFEKGIGSQSSNSTEFTFSNYLLFSEPLFSDVQIGVVGFSEFGNISNFKTYHQQEHTYGVQFEKEIELNDYEFEIVLGYLQGLTSASSSSSILWNLEIEF